MKLPLKYIAIFVIVALVGVFSYQAYWLVRLYQSQKEEMDEKVNLALSYAHIMEMGSEWRNFVQQKIHLIDVWKQM